MKLDYSLKELLERLKHLRQYLKDPRMRYPLKEHVNLKQLKGIADTRFPEYKSYTKVFINGTFLCIKRNALYRVLIRVKHNTKKRTTILEILPCPTVLGSLLLGPLWLGIAHRKFSKDVQNVFNEEMIRL